MVERMTLLGYGLWMKGDRLPKIILVGQPPKAKRKSSSSKTKEGGGRKGRLECKSTERRCVHLRWLGAVVSC